MKKQTKPAKRGPLPGAANAGRPATGRPRRVVLSCRVAPATLATLRALGPRLGETLDRLAQNLPSKDATSRPAGTP